MHKISVIPSDRIIIVDEEILVFDFKATENLHALHWFGTEGFAEWKDKGNTALSQQDYDTQVAPYLALWQAEKARIEKEKQDAEALYNSFEKVKERKVDELNSKWQAAEASGIVQSSLGYPINANERANRDVAGLLSQLELSSVTTAQFCDANNNFHTVTLDNLKVLQLELIQYGQVTYATKWKYRDAIDKAKTVDDLNAINITFVTDYTPTTVTVAPATAGANIDEKTSGPMLARALEWVGGTDQALAAGAIRDLAKSVYTSTETTINMLTTGMTAWSVEYIGSGDVQQTIPNITNERDGFLLFIKNSKTSGNVVLLPGGDDDTIDGGYSYKVTPGHSVLMVSCDAQSRWVVVYDSGQNISKKPVYIETDAPVTIPEGLHRIVLAFQNSSDTIVQTLPDLRNTVRGAHIQIRNIRTDGGLVELAPYTGQTVNGISRAYIVAPNTDVFLLAEEDDWFVWYTASHVDTEDTTLNIKDTKVSILDVQYPLEAQVNSAEKKATLNINPSAYQPMTAPGIYAVLSDDVSVLGGSPTHVNNGKVFCGEVIYPGDPFLRLNATTKGLTIQDVDPKDDPNVSGGTPFLVIAHVAFDQIANEDFDITCRLWSQKQGLPAEDVLADVNGRLLSVTRKAVSGKAIEDIVIEGIVMAKELQDIGISISHTATSDVLQLGGRVRGGTCLVAQAITEKNHTGPALQCYEQDFNKSVLFEKKYFGELASVQYWAEQSQVEHSTPAGQTSRQANGWCLDNVSPVTFTIQNDAILFIPTKDITDFCFSWDANRLDTAALRGKELDIVYSLNNPSGAFNLVFLKWTDPNNPASEKKIASRINGTITWAPGWELVSSQFIEESSTKDFKNAVVTVTVPLDAEQFAVGLVPNAAQSPVELAIKEFKVITVNPFYSFEMAGSDIMKAKVSTTAVFEQGLQDFVSLRYTINDTFVTMPCGKKTSGSAEVAVDDNINNIAGSDLSKDGGVFVVGEDTYIDTYIKAMLANEQAMDTVVEFQMFTYDSNGKATEIPECNVLFKVPANTPAKLYKGVLPRFMATSGTQFATRMRSDRQDGAYLYTEDVTPLISYKFVLV